MTRSTLGEIRSVTFTVPDLGVIEHAYVRELGYVVAGRGRIREAQAVAWGAPGVVDARSMVLAPASEEPVFLRFVEDETAAGWNALRTYGWNVAEFVVQDVDALAARLDGGAFEIIGPPRPLTRFPMIRAMQVRGPAGECCYFTEVGPGSGLNLATARSFVGRVFIVVAAGPDADAMFAPYAAFANAVDPPVSTPVRVISAAHGLPPETAHRHGLVRLAGGTLIELDEYPSTACARRTAEDRLAPGMAIVGFDVASIDEPRTFPGPTADCGLPGIDARAACLRGAVGELIELVSDRAYSDSVTRNRGWSANA